MIQNTHESIAGAKCLVRNALGKRPVFHRFESQSARLREYGDMFSSNINIQEVE